MQKSKKSMKHKIAPSLLAADFLNLQREVEMINESDACLLYTSDAADE